MQERVLLPDNRRDGAPEANQTLKVIGGAVFCSSHFTKNGSSCKNLARAYCKCGMPLCTEHIGVHRCFLKVIKDRYDYEVAASFK